MIGSLLYLFATRPDIMLSVGMCAWYQATLEKSHLVEVKRVFWYLIHTQSFGLWYPKGSSFELVGYWNSDLAGDKVDKNQPLGLANFLIGPWCVGLPRSKIACLSPPPKPSMWRWCIQNTCINFVFYWCIFLHIIMLLVVIIMFHNDLRGSLMRTSHLLIHPLHL
jgi:hypothetical protein